MKSALDWAAPLVRWVPEHQRAEFVAIIRAAQAEAAADGREKAKAWRPKTAMGAMLQWEAEFDARLVERARALVETLQEIATGHAADPPRAADEALRAWYKPASAAEGKPVSEEERAAAEALSHVLGQTVDRELDLVMRAEEVAEAVAAEREGCAIMLEGQQHACGPDDAAVLRRAAALIRARKP